MSASNGGVLSEENKNFFTAVQQPFPEILDGKINTAHFLESSRGVVVLVEKFGKVFAPVKYDMSGNIQKLSDRYITDTEKYKFLNDMILSEKEAGGIHVTDALLWLRRALHFFHEFFQCVLNDSRDGTRDEDLVPFLKKAYKETLERYHGWMAQQLFGLISRMCPCRSDLLLTLSLGHEGQEESVMRSLDDFLQGLNSNIQLLIEFYQTHGLESDVRV
ncbi:hypothetical protein R5R35_006341 [Gryllus longicercus]|uniref:Glycolipid transfer protein domain-containing protein n=1 Tax=Gryllus longicercus TaxID=2509291 RepID=A0AAN9VZX8_9ORTH